ARLRLGLPSKGMEERALAFFAECGLAVVRPNPRQYYATIAGLPEAEVVFQRAADIHTKVADGTLDAGVTGLDIVREHEQEGDDVVVALAGLGFGRCQLLLAIPDAWVDVSGLADLIEVANERRAR